MFLRNSKSLGYYFAFVSSPFSLLLLLFMMIALLLGVQIYAVNDTSITAATNTTKSSFESGYDHGCSDVKISEFSDRYINQPGKGPSYHTEEFMRGYDTGYNTCS
jgi:hypothetical protein